MFLPGAIQKKLTKKEIQQIVSFLSYHLNYSPAYLPTVIFAKTAKEFTKYYRQCKSTDDDFIEELNESTYAFYAHTNNIIVFQGFSYVEGNEDSRFIISLNTVIHEFLHYFQYATGTFGKYRIFFEGIPELLSCFFTNDYQIDYQIESIIIFNLIMHLVNNDEIACINWMKKYLCYSNKDVFIRSELKTCPELRKINLKLLDEINSISTIPEILSRYSINDIQKKLQNVQQIVKL